MSVIDVAVSTNLRLVSRVLAVLDWTLTYSRHQTVDVSPHFGVNCLAVLIHVPHVACELHVSRNWTMFIALYQTPKDAKRVQPS